MRAGHYAVVHDVTYGADSEDGETFQLLVPGSEPQPPGFEREQRYWVREVQRAEISRLFHVSTTATWRDRTVKVLEVLGDRAHIEYRGADFNGEPELTLTDYSVWSGWVPVESLTDVVETVRNFDQ